MILAIAPGLLFFDPSAEKAEKPAVKKHTAVQPKKEKRLFCATCRHPITHQEERISMQGSHEHRCTNPHGITYQFGCFRQAYGCTTSGAATHDYSWFPGYSWRIALCAHCRAHLGWHFQAEGDNFHGLIFDRLVSAGAATP